MFTIIGVSYLGIAAAYIFLIERLPWKLNPVVWYVIFNVILYVGTWPQLSNSYPADQAYAVGMLVALISFLAGSMLTDQFVKTKSQDVYAWWAKPIDCRTTRRFEESMWVMIVVSVLITALYYNSIGYNVFLLSMKNMFSPSSQQLDIATLRIASYSGEKYFAPGYVNQFKNTILPLLTGLIFIRALLLNRKADKISATILIPVSLISILGTGQRGAFIVLVLIMFMFMAAVFPPSLMKRYLTRMGIVLVGFLFLSTFLLGRSKQSFGEQGVFFSVLGEIGKRLFIDNQESGLIGFRYVYDLPVQYGAEWGTAILGAVPGSGSHGSSLSNKIFEVMFGTSRGTAPLSIWGSVWYNWGASGLVIFPIILGSVFRLLPNSLIKGHKSLFRVLIYAALTIYLGTWIVDGPTTLLNQGALTVIILYFMLRVFIPSPGSARVVQSGIK